MARDGGLMAYRQDGFWQCMDTMRDLLQLEALWQHGELVFALDLVGTIRQLMGARDLEPDVRVASSGETPSQHVSAEKARRVLGWMPQYSLEQGPGTDRRLVG